MPSRGGSPQGLHKFWRENVSAASLAYNSAKQESVRVLEHLSRLSSPSAYDLAALKTAHLIESAALDEFMGALRRFHEFFVKQLPQAS
jgi:hypothetical protein